MRIISGHAFRWMLAALLVFGMRLGAAPTQERPPSEPLPSSTSPQTGLPSLAGAWGQDLPAALLVASMEFKPVLAVFTSSDCPWCTRLKNETLASREVTPLLQQFILVEVNAEDNPNLLTSFHVRNIPVLMILSSDSRERVRWTGFISATDLARNLKEFLGGKSGLPSAKSITENLARMKQGKATESDWLILAESVGNENHRPEILKAMAELTSKPKRELVQLLENPSLAIRLGAIELLEELSGDDMNFDPWNIKSPENQDSLAKWKLWADPQSNQETPRLEKLDPASLLPCFLDLVSDNRGKSLRASRTLARKGPQILPWIVDFEKTHPDLSLSARLQLREMRYTLILPSIRGSDPQHLAHQLLHGNPDARLSALRSLSSARRRAVPIIQDFLTDPEPMIRETAIDTLIATHDKKTVSILEEFLKTEKDINVCHSALKGLGEFPSKKGLAILCSYLRHADEDLVITALQSIKKLKSTSAADAIKDCLGDSRWRIRVAAIETVSELNATALSPDIKKLLEDPDDFVRTAALTTYAKLDGSACAPLLESMFYKESAPKAVILEQLLRLDTPLSDKLLKAAVAAPTEVLIGMLDGMKSADHKAIPLLRLLLDHPDPDVRCASLRLITPSTFDSREFEQLILRRLKAARQDETSIILQNLRVNDEQLKKFNPAALKFSLFPPAADPKQSPGAPQTPSAEKEMEQLFGLFSTPKTETANIYQEFVALARHHLSHSPDAETRHEAAVMLLKWGYLDGIPPLLASLSSLTSAQKNEIAGGLEHSRQPGSLELIRSLLKDPSEEVRQRMISGLFERPSGPDALELIFQELSKPNSPIKITEVWEYGFFQILESGNSKATTRKWVLQQIQLRETSPFLIPAIMLLENCWKDGDDKLLEPFAKSENPWIRRAVGRVFSTGNNEKFIQSLPSILEDPSEHVRMVIPSAYAPTDYHSVWMDHFSEKDFSRRPNVSYYSSSSNDPVELPETARSALQKLTQDPSPMVRFESYMALMNAHEPLSLTSLALEMEGMTDSTVASQRISTFLENHHSRLGPEFIVLLPYLEKDLRQDRRDSIYKHFKISEADDLPDITQAPASSKVMASYLDGGNDARPAPSSSQKISLVYFSKPGCSECARTGKILASLRENFPGLTIRELNLNLQSSVRYCEALCERFSVPDSQRLVAPSIFTSAGYLIRDDITPVHAGELLIRSSFNPSEDWMSAKESELVAADNTLIRRYSALSLGVVGMAGLLDGLNPCAFATIIFLLSYLQVARKTKSELIQIGSVYILGVFLAYFLLGLGLVELITRFQFISWAGKTLNYLMAGFALIIASLNFRDGILCLQGRLKDVTLQLPEAFKMQIHQMVRVGVRHRHFIIAAFLMGMGVSFLELACTGQVYAPTIIYMLRSGHSKAVFYLLYYNLAFIIPLTVVFILAYYGLTSTALLSLLQKRAAWVKFGMFLLFLTLAVLMLGGEHFLGH